MENNNSTFGKENFTRFIETPLGRVFLQASHAGLQSVFLDETRTLSGQSESHPILDCAEHQLLEYFEGKRFDFTIPLDMRGTPFQLQAWKQLQSIPYGKTISYQEQASRVGDLKKARAVGMANSRNPICIVVPCHRVIGKNGTLTGFTGGLDKKEKLLQLEAQFKARKSAI